jgi:rhodanese-related sulfurtransferase
MQPSILSCEDARALVARGGQLLDVREPQEFQRSALPGAVNIPLSMIQYAGQRLARSRPVLVYCATGRRSGIAKLLLEASGFTQVHNIGSQEFYRRCGD